MNENKENIKRLNNKIKASEQKIVEYKNNIKNLEKDRENFEKISKNIFTKLINYKTYKINKNIDFGKEIIKMQVAKETENKQIEQYIKEKHSLEKETDKLKKQYQKIEREFQELQIEDEEIETKLTEIKLIEEFNKKNKIKYCS